MNSGAGQQLYPQSKAEQAAPFLDFCLPRTIILAKRNRSAIVPQLEQQTAGLPYEDRLLIWLHPFWKESVEQFHRSGGKSMAALFQAEGYKFQIFDEYYAEKLEARLERQGPANLTQAPIP